MASCHAWHLAQLVLAHQEGLAAHAGYQTQLAGLIVAPLLYFSIGFWHAL